MNKEIRLSAKYLIVTKAGGLQLYSDFATSILKYNPKTFATANEHYPYCTLYTVHCKLKNGDPDETRTHDLRRDRAAF